MTRAMLICVLILTSLSAACGSRGLNQASTAVRTIDISDTVKPHTVYARTGEEIRWRNLRTNPLLVGFLSMQLLEELGCKEGVSTFFGEVEDLVTIKPGESVGLCPLHSGVLQYNVWFDATNPRAGISRTGTVHVEHGG